MKKFMLSMGILTLLAAFWVPANAASRVSLGLTIGSGAFASFRLSVSEYYRAPEREVVYVRERGIADEELPVVYFIARRAGVSPSAIVDLRRGGWGWWRIADHYRLDPEDFYIPCSGIPRGSHYWKAYDNYDRYPRDQWNRFSLTDQDVIDFVNLRLIAERYDVDPITIILSRQRGSHFYEIDKDMGRRYSSRSDNRYDEGRFETSHRRSESRDRERIDRDGDRGREYQQPTRDREPSGSNDWNRHESPRPDADRKWNREGRSRQDRGRDSDRKDDNRHGDREKGRGNSGDRDGRDSNEHRRH